MGMFKKKNAEEQSAPAVEPEWLEEELSLSERFKQWLMHDSPSWMISALFHTVLLLMIGLFMGGKVIVDEMTDTTVIESAKRRTGSATAGTLRPDGNARGTYGIDYGIADHGASRPGGPRGDQIRRFRQAFRDGRGRHGDRLRYRRGRIGIQHHGPRLGPRAKGERRRGSREKAPDKVLAKAEPA